MLSSKEIEKFFSIEFNIFSSPSMIFKEIQRNKLSGKMNSCLNFFDGRCRHQKRHRCFESVKHCKRKTKKIAKEFHNFNSLTKNQQQKLLPF